MGRPLNKKYFGTGAGNDFRVHAKIGSAAAGAGSIVRQRGSKRFEVKVGSNVGVCHLVDKDMADLVAGEMTLAVQDADDNVQHVLKIAGHKATLADGSVSAWSFAPATDDAVEMEEESDTFGDDEI